MLMGTHAMQEIEKMRWVFSSASQAGPRLFLPAEIHLKVTEARKDHEIFRAIEGVANVDSKVAIGSPTPLFVMQDLPLLERTGHLPATDLSHSLRLATKPALPERRTTVQNRSGIH